MARRGSSNNFPAHPGFQLLFALLVVGTLGLLVRDLGNDSSTWDIVLRAVTAAGWLTLLIAGHMAWRRPPSRRVVRSSGGPETVGFRAVR